MTAQFCDNSLYGDYLFYSDNPLYGDYRLYGDNLLYGDYQFHRDTQLYGSYCSTHIVLGIHLIAITHFTVVPSLMRETWYEFAS